MSFRDSLKGESNIQLLWTVGARVAEPDVRFFSSGLVSHAFAFREAPLRFSTTCCLSRDTFNIGNVHDKSSSLSARWGDLTSLMSLTALVGCNSPGEAAHEKRTKNSCA